uniref:Uncharacterized protein n=1 Tax=Mycena chlorophos TaxID=658473 RepID=A0ABQ0KZ78_MYCCL|nr:predicted protein [Mycena chlorophos]
MKARLRATKTRNANRGSSPGFSRSGGRLLVSEVYLRQDCQRRRHTYPERAAATHPSPPAAGLCHRAIRGFLRRRR